MQKTVNYQNNDHATAKVNVIGFVLLAAVALFAAACGALGTSDKAAAQVAKNPAGLALDGYDSVAYFKENLPREGKPEFTADYNGAKWQFVSAENRDAFNKEPAKYAPQYGGYCAWAVGHNYTAKGDPQAWKIVDDKLYLNYNKDVQAKWQEDIPKYIQDGDQNWKNLAPKAEDARKDKK